VRFSVLSDIEFTGLYGKLAGIKKPSGYLELISADDETQKYSTTIGSDSTFGFTAIKPGKYKLFFFYDTNGDKKWSSGSLLPFAFSEECIYFKDVISLPARWAVTDLQFDVSGVEGD
jgi:hypothetical protein